MRNRNNCYYNINNYYNYINDNDLENKITSNSLL